MKRVLTRTGWAAALAIVCAAAAAPLPAMAEDGNDSFLGLDLNGSLGEGRHSRYVPPLTNPVFNETPYITTEVRAIYLYNRLPEDFVTDRTEEHTSELQSLMRISYAVFCLQKKKN